MSRQQRDASILILQIIGTILIFVTVMLAGVILICAFGLEVPNMSARCSDGTPKEVLFTVIGAAGALWGASMMKGVTPRD
jgi:hypothetical protein